MVETESTVAFEQVTLWPERAVEVLELPAPAAGPPEVHVYAGRLDVSPWQVEEFAETLSAAEFERAGRFHFEQHRRRYIVARGLLRRALAQYLHIRPGEIEFTYGPHGKPALAGEQEASGLQFNLAHSEDWALLAFVRDARVGVDLERVRALKDMDELVERFFSCRENQAFQKLDAALKPVAFFNLWTRKEAWLKATGEGLGEYLNQVEVTFVPGQPACLQNLPPCLGQTSRWCVRDLAPAKGLAGALAVAAPQVTVETWSWANRSEGG